jgi:hypothetical protein
MMPYGSPAAQPMLAPTLVPMKIRNFTRGRGSRKRTRRASSEIPPTLETGKISKNSSCLAETKVHCPPHMEVRVEIPRVTDLAAVPVGHVIGITGNFVTRSSLRGRMECGPFD